MTEEPPSAGHRDRRVERTRRLLTEALHELIRERDYDTITVQDILDRADVGRSTFYAHFRNKDHLLLGNFSQGPRGQPWPTGDLDLFEHMAESYDLYRSLAGTEGLPAAMGRLRRTLSEAWRARLTADDGLRDHAGVAPEVAEHFLTGALMAVVEWWLEAGMPYPPKRMNIMLERLVAGALAGAAVQGGGRSSG